MKAGFAKEPLSVFVPGMCMFGWARPSNVASGVALPLFARAMAIEDDAGKRAVFVVADLGMISESLRRAVVRRVCTPEAQLTEHDLVLTATHTHSGPSGYSTYLMYAVCAPGVSRHVHDFLAGAIAEAIEGALAKLEPARLWVHAGAVPLSEPIAFNRSIAAYNRNPDAGPVTPERSDEAVDRTMTVLRADDAQGEPLGLLSWFAVHGTSMHADNRMIHGDNKGYASLSCEGWAKERGRRDFVALFAQESAGDVSPNYRLDRRRNKMLGRYDDDDESARFNGEIQARHARVLFARAIEDGDAVDGPIETGLRHVDFFDLPVDGAPSLDHERRTAPPRVGLGFSVGTSDGWGPLPLLRRHIGWMTATAARFESARRTEAPPHAGKIPLWDLAPSAGHRILGLLPPHLLVLGPGISRYGGYFRRAVARSKVRGLPWAPRHLPLQQIRVGSLLVATIPHEATTQCGRRLRRSVLESWRGSGVTRSVITPYSNAYCSYLTTPEEYDAQCYEGAATLYGRATLPAIRDAMKALALEIRDGRGHASLGTVPETIPLEWLPPMLADQSPPRSHIQSRSASSVVPWMR